MTLLDFVQELTGGYPRSAVTMLAPMKLRALAMLMLREEEERRRGPKSWP
jgi:hypothetical protein